MPLKVVAKLTPIFERLIEQLPCPFVSLVAQLNAHAHTIFPFLVIEQSVSLKVIHVLHGCPLQGKEDIVFVGLNEFVTGRHHIILIREAQIVDGELSGQIVLFVE